MPRSAVASHVSAEDHILQYILLLLLRPPSPPDLTSVSEYTEPLYLRSHVATLDLHRQQRAEQRVPWLSAVGVSGSTV